MILSRFSLCVTSLLLCACSEAVDANIVTSNMVETPYILEAKEAARDKFDSQLSFLEIYENKKAVCGEVKKSDGEPQQFIYVRKHFLLEEVSPGGEWESLWFSECYDE